jgi:hypothetical protein
VGSCSGSISQRTDIILTASHCLKVSTHPHIRLMAEIGRFYSLKPGTGCSLRQSYGP